MKGRYDAVLVLGLELNSDDSATPELEARLQTAAEAWRRMGADCGKIVLCGGVQPGHHTAEANVMAKWLRQAGVPVERIILERQSQDTMGNCRCAARLLGGAEGKRVLVVTSDYHLPRAVMTARRVGFRADGKAAKTADRAKKMLMEACYILDLLLGWQDEGKGRPAWTYALFGMIFGKDEAEDKRNKPV